MRACNFDTKLFGGELANGSKKLMFKLCSYFWVINKFVLFRGIGMLADFSCMLRDLQSILLYYIIKKIIETNLI
jgi:hypothetical protein